MKFSSGSLIGIYMRLSRDDEKEGESASIEHQRLILRKFVGDNGGKIAYEYADDGWSGTDFDRPGIKKLLSDAQCGKINTVIVKDLSRFGRNYVKAGQFIDYVFPAYGVRFIAVADNVDTADKSSTATDMMAITNVFNEWHAAGTSKKIRAVLEASMRSGKYTGWNYPYGYKAGKDENRTAEIDEEAAEVVRRIFDMRLRGFSAAKIAAFLTESGISNPATHYTKLDGGKSRRRCSAFWSPKTVMHILSDPTYIGRTTQHKTTNVSYKNHKTVKVSPDEWIVREEAHLPLVSLDVWESVQTVNNSSSRGRADKTNAVHALSGFPVCPDCGKKMKLQGAKNGGFGFVCRTYKDLGAKFCASHYISEKTLQNVVLADLRDMLKTETFDVQKLKENFIKELSEMQNRNADEKRLSACRSKLRETERLIRSAFEEKILSGLPESVFKSLCDGYAAEREIILKRIAALEEKLANCPRPEAEAEEYIKKFREYLNFDRLPREASLQLIDRITVSSKTDAPRVINIYYKFGPCGN